LGDFSLLVAISLLVRVKTERFKPLKQSQDNAKEELRGDVRLRGLTLLCFLLGNSATAYQSNYQKGIVMEGTVTAAPAQLIAHCGTHKISRDDLALIQAPAATKTHQPVAHIDVVKAVIETLGFRRIAVVRDEYAVDKTGMKMFGVLDLEEEFFGCRFSIGLRNSNDKSMRLALTIGYRVFVCDNLAFRGDFTPVLAKHSASMNLIDVVSTGVDKMQRTFDPLRRQVELWQKTNIDDNTAKLVIYNAFIQGDLKASSRLLPDVHRLYFEDDRFPAGTFWRLSNAFTSAFKELKPVQQFQVTARLGGFLQTYFDSLPPLE
jgi:hypothetical protein